MGDETRQVVEKLDDVIRTMAVKVGRIDEWRKPTDDHLNAIDEKLTSQNGRIDELETFEDETKASRKTTAKWASAIVLAIGLLFSALKLWGCASPCAPGYDPPIKTDSVTVTRIDTCGIGD